MQVPIPIVITKEGKWFVAYCPVLDIATQGKTEEEVKDMMNDLINDYFRDPDTPKPEIKSIMYISLVTLPVDLPNGVIYNKTSSST